ncbi:MAG: NADP-dependent oxidoreductase [Paracoccaceae bacterium]
MRAYVLNRYGGPENAALTEVPKPDPGPRDILVAVKAAGLNPLDFKFRRGAVRPILTPRLPVVMGNEFAGEVVGLGRDVTGFQLGDRVFARTAIDRNGAFAERACVDQDHAALLPPDLDFTAAAAVPLAGLTALQALRDEIQVKPGMKVLITGGAGGVGGFAIQLAKVLGAHVTTTASPQGQALVRALGADAVIDYTKQTITEGGPRFDAGLDLIGGATLDQMFPAMRPGAKLVSVAGLPEPQTALRDLGNRRMLAALFWLISLGLRRRAARAGVRYRFLFMHPSGQGLADLASLIAEGRVKVTLDRSYPLSDIAEALAFLEAGRAKGKVVVTV